MDIVKISFEDIKYATDNFSNEKCIGMGALGKMFKGQLPHANGHKFIAAKLFDREYGQGDTEFYQELEILFKFKHRNVIGLEGYCDEMDERIIVYEYPSNGSLNDWLKKTDLTWMKRLEICIDVAIGLDFLHGGALRQEAVIHRDIKSSNILLSGDLEAKINDFGLSLISQNNQEIDYVKMETIAGTECYIDPAYRKTGIISKASDIYSFGVVLFEILCGISAYETSGYINNQQYLGPLAKNHYEHNKLNELVFEGIKEQIVPQSLSIYAKIAYNCLHDDRNQRPTASEVVAQLNEAKDFHVDCEMWESRLPSDYKEIIQQSGTPEICYTKKKKDLYDMLYEGILIQKGKVWFWLDSNNNRNEMISSTLFTYKNQSSQKWRRIRKARFERVSLMMDVSDLKIQIKITAKFLTLGATYGVYLVFKLGESNKISSEPMYVNLKYKREDKTLHAYFATWREDGWMMIELHRFLYDKDCGDFEAKHEEIEQSKDDVQQILSANSNMGQMQQFPADNDEIYELTQNYDMGAKVPFLFLTKFILCEK
ncbi:hypothetical protein SSX86_023725 [Deinandra increscens subsp. villosa]|uniref:Protein kinase domain-containing protein n=1 Tax=Deinandra increscens subsp. villosa TaxID=3103831 RepID=A0AAP0CMT7_9ASTR